jgi:hypothetical protein
MMKIDKLFYAGLMCFALSAGCNATGELDPEVVASLQTPAEDGDEKRLIGAEELIDIGYSVQGLGTCPAEVTCPGYGSCSSWSPATLCDEGLCFPRLCRECEWPGGCIYEPGQLQTYTEYRVCFNAQGAQCIEQNNWNLRECGCTP